jgi:mRNA interferase YafQ
MRSIEFGRTFKKDYRRMSRRGVKMNKLDAVLDVLRSDGKLEPRHRPHILSGEWKGFSECHIEPDWLLIYDLSDPEVVALHRTGTHADLFE